MSTLNNMRKRYLSDPAFKMFKKKYCRHYLIPNARQWKPEVSGGMVSCLAVRPTGIPCWTTRSRR